MLFSTTKLELTFDAGAFSAGRVFSCQPAIGNLSRPSNVEKMVDGHFGRETMEKRFIQAVLITLAFFAGVLPSWAEFRLEKDLKLAPGGRFVLESDAGSVTVTGSKASDRKSTRLNSSHLVISYAVFCLKKNTNMSSSTVLDS